jgi:hypothetical protein
VSALGDETREYGLVVHRAFGVEVLSLSRVPVDHVACDGRAAPGNLNG